MALNIKSPETERLVRELAAATGEPITTAVHRAALERLRRVKRPRDEARRTRLREIVEHSRSLPVLDPRSPDEILGYNEFGTFD